MSLKKTRALARLRSLRVEVERNGLPAQPNVYHVAALTAGAIEFLRGGDKRRASAAAAYLYRLAPASFHASGLDERLACQRGCSYCCHGYVSASAPQIFAAAAAVRADALTFEAACERIRALAGRVQGLEWRERIGLRQPCALLVDAACSIYGARPLACRGYVSLSLAACQRAFDTLSDEVPE